MKHTLAFIALVALSGCATATKDTVIRPLFEVKAPQQYFAPYDGFVTSDAMQCQATVSQHEFLACTEAVREATKKAYEGAPVFGPRRTTPSAHRSEVVVFSPDIDNTPRNASAFGTFQGPIYSSVQVRNDGAVGSTNSGGYPGNCPTPDSLDIDGHRCGARSAASRPGGYTGYE